MSSVSESLVQLTNKFIRMLEDLLREDGRLIYQAGFARDDLEPVVDLFSLGPLKWSVSSNIAVPRGAASMAYIPPADGQAGGVRLTLTRPMDLLTGSTAEGLVATTMVVDRFPQNLRGFVLKATFELPVGPHGPSDQWAVVLLARAGGLIDDRNAREADVRRITASLTSFYDNLANLPRARLNSPFATTIVDPGVLPRIIYDELFNPVVTAVTEKSGPVFRMEVRVNRSTARTEAWLFASNYTAYRLFSNVFSPSKHPGSGLPNMISVAGGGLAIGTGGGSGPVAVTLRDFRVWGQFDVPQPLSMLRNLVAATVLTPFRVIRKVLVGRPDRDAPPH